MPDTKRNRISFVGLRLDGQLQGWCIVAGVANVEQMQPTSWCIVSERSGYVLLRYLSFSMARDTRSSSMEDVSFVDRRKENVEGGRRQSHPSSPSISRKKSSRTRDRCPRNRRTSNGIRLMVSLKFEIPNRKQGALPTEKLFYRSSFRVKRRGVRSTIVQ